jgi:hypothetical protein
MTHDQFLEEPVEVVAWAVAFERMDDEVAAELAERGKQ